MRSDLIETNEEAVVYVRDWDLLVTVQLHEDTPSVLLLDKLSKIIKSLILLRVNRRSEAESFYTGQKNILVTPKTTCRLLLLVYQMTSSVQVQ